MFIGIFRSFLHGFLVFLSESCSFLHYLKDLFPLLQLNVKVVTVKTDVTRCARDMELHRRLKSVQGQRVKFGLIRVSQYRCYHLLIKYNFVIICQGVSGRVPPNSPLLFEVEVLRVCSACSRMLLCPLCFNLLVGFCSMYKNTTLSKASGNKYVTNNFLTSCVYCS